MTKRPVKPHNGEQSEKKTEEDAVSRGPGGVITQVDDDQPVKLVHKNIPGTTQIYTTPDEITKRMRKIYRKAFGPKRDDDDPSLER